MSPWVFHLHLQNRDTHHKGSVGKGSVTTEKLSILPVNNLSYHWNLGPKIPLDTADNEAKAKMNYTLYPNLTDWSYTQDFLLISVLPGGGMTYWKLHPIFLQIHPLSKEKLVLTEKNIKIIYTKDSKNDLPVQSYLLKDS